MLENPLVSEVNKVFLNYRLFRRSLASPGKDDGNFCFLTPLHLTLLRSAHEETMEKPMPFAARFPAERFERLAACRLRYRHAAIPLVCREN
ncbi:hypothetical protein AGR7B_Cc40047 [Agrobacterium deltaense RV3]|nr:hypothetical protein AGR7B_Cc40047 [Agrobacterium deltaense RV3]